MADYAKDVLVETDWVEQHHADPDVAVVEVDEDTEAYGRGHIPGAIAFNWRTDLQDSVKRDFISKDDLSKLLGSNGIGNDTLIVLYGGNNNWFAAYAYWYLKFYGHGPVKLMDAAGRSGSSKSAGSRPARPKRRPPPATGWGASPTRSVRSGGASRRRW